MKHFLSVLAAALLACSTTSFAQNKPTEKPIINPAPTAKDWADIGKLPDWSGV